MGWFKLQTHLLTQPFVQIYKEFNLYVPESECSTRRNHGDGKRGDEASDNGDDNNIIILLQSKHL